MKSILEFNLPEEREEFEMAVNGCKYKCQLDEIYQNLIRRRRKYGYEEKNIDELLDNLANEYYLIVNE